MTKAEIKQREEAYKRAGVCFVCGKPYADKHPQYAHRIANTKMNRDKYGSFIIDHTLNGEIVCSLACNQAMNIGYDKGKVLALICDITLFEMRKFMNGKQN